EPVQLKVRLRYRKFDFEYMSLVHGVTRMVELPLGFEVTVPGDPNARVPQLPVVDICEDSVTLPVAGNGAARREPAGGQASPIKPPWQRWNDYGIACLIEGGVGTKRGELLQAEKAFEKVMEFKEKMPQIQGRINLARVALDLGDLDQAREHLNKV